MLFSTATGYALRTLAVMPEDGSYSLAKNLAARLGLPGPYLAKILQSLAQQGMLQSVRGPRGGFRLSRPAKTISVGEVVKALEGIEAMTGCIMGFTHCDKQDNPCPLHEPWGQVKAHMEASMTEVTIGDLQAMDLRIQHKDPIHPRR